MVCDWSARTIQMVYIFSGDVKSNTIETMSIHFFAFSKKATSAQTRALEEKDLPTIVKRNYLRLPSTELIS